MKRLIYLLLLLNFFDIYSQNKEIPVKTEVSEATVFINGAQVIRRKSIELLSGNTVVKFVDLSPYVDSKSVQVRANGEVTVLSVNHQYNYIDSASRSKELDDLNNKVKIINDKINVENVNLEIIIEELTFLKDNRTIGGKNQELSLNNLKETSNFYRDRVSTLKMKEIEVNKNLENLNLEKSAIDKQLKQISSNKPMPTSEVLVKLSAKAQSKCDLELSYYVNNAGWFPSYDIRAKSIDEPIELVYKANIHQNTKEEWKNIKLKLSSSNPNLGSVAPQLQTYYLNYNTLPPRYTNLSSQVSGKILDAETNEPMIGASVTIKGTTIGTISDIEGNYSISIPSNNSELVISFVGYQSQTQLINNPVMNFYLKQNIQRLDEVVVVGYGTQKKSILSSALQGRASGISIRGTSSLQIPVTQVENQTSVEFEIKTPYSINSDNKNLTVDIDDYSLDANYEYYCAPKIDKDAFLIANIVNWEKYNLLEGEANVFFENTFVGKSIIDVRYISDTLRLSLGRDKNVIVKREKIKDFTTKQFLGSKKEETRAWQISIKNNKKQPINMNLYDQVPISTNDEIEVLIENISGGLLNKDKGEVNWKLKFEQSEKKDLELKYKVKYPKDRILTIE